MGKNEVPATGSCSWSWSAVLLLLIFTAVCTACCTKSADVKTRDIESEKTETGRVLYPKLASAPFPHPKREKGYTFRGSRFPADPHYTDSTVAVFIPEGFEPKNRVDLVFYFHGWYTSVKKAPKEYQLYRQFAESGVNSLLVLPEGPKNAADSFGGKLESPGGFSRLAGEVIEIVEKHKIIKKPRLGSVVLAGHSGGYRVISHILSNGDLAGRIEGVLLFDALFDNAEMYAEWIVFERGRFAAVYTGGGTTEGHTRELMKLLDGQNIDYRVLPDDPAVDLGELDEEVIFIRSPYDHYGVLYKAGQFKRLLLSVDKIRMR